MQDDFDWIMAQDERTGRFKPKAKLKKKRPAPPRDPNPLAERPKRAPRLPRSFYADIFGVGLTRQEEEVVDLMCRRGVVSIKDVVDHLFSDPLDERPWRPKRQHAQVVIGHVRSKLEERGYTIYRPAGGHGLASSFYFLKPVEGRVDAAA